MSAQNRVETGKSDIHLTYNRSKTNIRKGSQKKGGGATEKLKDRQKYKSRKYKISNLQTNTGALDTGLDRNRNQEYRNKQNSGAMGFSEAGIHKYKRRTRNETPTSVDYKCTGESDALCGT